MPFLCSTITAGLTASRWAFSVIAPSAPETPGTVTFYVDQIVGTPDECIRRLEHVKDKNGCEEVIMQVIYGGMPPEVGRVKLQRTPRTPSNASARR